MTRLLCLALLCFWCVVPLHAQMLTGYSDPSVSIYPSWSAQTISQTPSVEIIPLPDAAPVYDPSVSIFSLPDSTNTAALSSPRLTGYDTAAVQSTDSSQQPVDLQADSLSYDDTGKIVTASGDVVMTQEGRRLSADQIVYNVAEDSAYAQGDVILTDQNGDEYRADRVALDKALDNGTISALKAELQDGSRFWAQSAQRKDGTETVLKDARYTACKPCKNNPDKPPVWQIKAKEVKHDKIERQISYKNATFEMLGVPVLYSPYLSHPDGTIKRKSGFLTPSAGFQSDTGFFVQSDYYTNIAPDKDATIGMRVMTKQAPLALAEYRQRWNNAGLNISGGVTHSSRSDDIAGLTVQQDDEWRGHIFGDARWDMNEKWRSGARINLASDDQYLRQYDLDKEDVLQNELYAERFSGRNYAAGRLLTFQDTRVDERRLEDQPQILPEILAGFIGDPGSVPVIGGRWDATASLLGLRREGNNQDQTRASLKLGWERALRSDIGLIGNIRAQTRGDVYYINDAPIGSKFDDENDTQTRLYSALHMDASYPLAKPLQNGQILIAPKAALTLTPHVGQNSDIPNEDSQDTQINATNVFNINRFPGFDRVEDSSRVTYGLNTGYYRDNGDYFSAFAGQSYRVNNDANIFPEGSGLENKASDYVGQLALGVGKKHQLHYDFQVDSETMASKRHEIFGRTGIGKLSLDASYLYAAALEGTAIDENREQFYAAALYRFNPQWAVRLGGTHDFGEDPGLRRARFGVDYSGQCFSLSLTGQRNYTDDASGESDTELFLRIGLKNLGEFETSGLGISSTE